MNYDMEINNAEYLMNRMAMIAYYHNDILDTAYFDKLVSKIVALLEAKKVFKLNAEYEKPNPNRVSCLLKHQVC